MNVSERMKTGGIVAKRGFRYQDYIVAKRLLCDKWQLLHYEQDGADYFNYMYDISEDQNLLCFYQSKQFSLPYITPSLYFNEVLPNFLDIYLDNKSKELGLIFIFESNSPLNPQLEMIFKLCKYLRENKIHFSEFNSRLDPYRSLKKNFFSKLAKLSKDDQYRFCRGLIFEKKTIEELSKEIIDEISNLIITHPREKMLELLGYIYEKNDGIISRNEIFSKLNLPTINFIGHSLNVLPISQELIEHRKECERIIYSNQEKEIFHLKTNVNDYKYHLMNINSDISEFGKSETTKIIDNLMEYEGILDQIQDEFKTGYTTIRNSEQKLDLIREDITTNAEILNEITQSDIENVRGKKNEK